MMLCADSLWKSYRAGRSRKPVLKGVSFRIAKGRCLGILGRPASGKSTLLKLLANVEPPDRGSVSFAGSVSWPVGFKGWFARHLSAEENLRFMANLYGADPDDVVDYVHDFAEVTHSFFQPWHSVPGDQQNRIAFAASLAIPFDVYLLDGDPVQGRPEFRKKCLDALSEQLEHCAMVLVARRPQQLDALATHYGVLNNGTLRRFRQRAKAVQHYSQEAA